VSVVDVRVHGGVPATAPIRLFDTARRSVVDFAPGPLVSMYVCGITPYDATHLGHAATYLMTDLLQRRLVDRGHVVQMVRNITDVDDDILRAARTRDVHYLDLAAGQIARFDKDLEALAIQPVWSEPRATGAIPDIRGLIAMVLDRGHAYQSGGGVYFSVVSSPSFGRLSGLTRAEMAVVGPARGERPDDPYKRDPLDFVLWQPSVPGEPAWSSPWGPGRPGWHVECSALALRELGATLDLHAGGRDLVYPHHECEQAQSEAATGEPFVRHWLHQELVQYQGQKMSKSSGNLVFVRDLCEMVEPAVVRTALLDQHHRRPWTWHADLLGPAAERLARWRRAAHRLARRDDHPVLEPVPATVFDNVLDAVRDRLDDDLDAPGALRAIDAAVAVGVDPDDLRDSLALLGVTV
jgi:L-cysteine:1D-myo-inositol 2-amino-2-deoxy-alpha-D-glucopyranoside ligase